MDISSEKFFYFAYMNNIYSCKHIGLLLAISEDARFLFLDGDITFQSMIYSVYQLHDPINERDHYPVYFHPIVMEIIPAAYVNTRNIIRLIL